MRKLIYDDTGQGWAWHMLYGTSKVLEVLTAENCRTGAGRELFLEIRVFEIARSMLFGQRSFLSTTPWLDLVDSLWQGEHIRDWNPKERLLDIMTLVSDLYVRSVLLYDLSHQSSPLTTSTVLPTTSSPRLRLLSM